MKKYKVLFFTTAVGPNGDPLGTALPNPLVGNAIMPVHLAVQPIDGHEFQIRDFTRIGTSLTWKGVFGRLRDDAPNVVNVQGLESVIPLQQTDRLLEKCHFLYMEDHDILIWQVNNDVAHVSRFTNYLSLLMNTPVFANTVVGANALQRVIAGTVKSIECKVATPRVPLGQIPNYSQPMFDLMNGVQGSTIKINISAGRGALAGNVRQLINWAMGNPDTKALKAKIEGEIDPVDLLVNRISDSIQVQLYGHYPRANDVFNGLDQAFTNKTTELAPFFRR